MWGRVQKQGAQLVSLLLISVASSSHLAIESATFEVVRNQVPSLKVRAGVEARTSTASEANLRPREVRSWAVGVEESLM